MNLDQKTIIALVGEMASGKDSIAVHLAKNYNAQTVSFSQPLRDILDRLHLPQNRINMANLGADLRQTFGQDLLNHVIIDEIEASEKVLFCLPNIRLESDMIAIKELPRFILVAVDTTPAVRFDRLTHRHQNSDDEGKTWEQFLADSQLPTEIEIRNIMKQAKYKIDNNGTADELIAQVDKIMAEILA